MSRISAEDALLDVRGTFAVDQAVSVRLWIDGGLTLDLEGTVAKLEEGKPLIHWTFAADEDREKVDALLRDRLTLAPPRRRVRREKPRAPSAGDEGAEKPQEASEAKVDEKAPSPSETPEPSEAPPQEKPAPKAVAKRADAVKQLAERRARRAALAKRAQPSTSKSKDEATLVRAGDRIDIQATLRTRAKLMKASDLASKMHTVQVLNTATVKDLIRDAVSEAVEFMGSTLDEKERKRLLEEAEQGFKERMRIAEAEKAGLEAKTHLLQEELKKARAVLDEERNRVVSDYQFTVSDAGLVELEQRLGRILDNALRKGKAGSELEEELRETVSRLLDTERERIREQAEQAQSDRIALLEKKVQRLATSLDSAEKERDKAQRRAQILEKSGGGPLRNVMEAGLDEEDPDKERKLSLLREIFEFNKQVRSELARSGRLAAGRAPREERAEVRKVPDMSPQEESTLAESLGIKVRRPAEEALAEKEAAEAATSSTDTDVIQGQTVPATVAAGDASGAIDPDDLPWEAPEDMDETVDRWKIVRNLGD